MCAHILTRLPAADGDEAPEIADQFSTWSSPCYGHRSRYVDLLQRHLNDRTGFASAGALAGLRGLCGMVRTPSRSVHGVPVVAGMTPPERRRITDLAAGFAGPDNGDAPSRAVSLEALCVCDRARSRPLVSKAARSSSDEERLAASDEECR
jgi:hypothetical protein